MGMRRLADPEKVAAVFEACKELRVPIGEDRFVDDGGGPTSEDRDPQENGTNRTEKQKYR